MTWALPAGDTDTDTELWEHTASTPFSSATLIWRGKATRVLIPKSADTTTRYYWVRNIDRYGDTSATFPAVTGVAGAAALTTMGDIDPDAVTEIYSATDTGPDAYGFPTSQLSIISVTFTPPVACTLILTCAFDYNGFDGDSGHLKSLYATQSAVKTYGSSAGGAGAGERTTLSDVFAVSGGASVTAGLEISNGLSSSSMTFSNMTLRAELILR